MELLQFKLGIPAAHPDFEGHFPGFPLLPAVSQISLVKVLIEQHLGYPIECTSVTRSKFKAMLRPDTEVEVELSLPSVGEVRWKIADGTQIYSLGNLHYEQEKEATAISTR